MFTQYHLLVIVILQGSSKPICHGKEFKIEEATFVDVGRYHCIAEYGNKGYNGSFNVVIEGKCGNNFLIFILS